MLREYGIIIYERNSYAGCHIEENDCALQWCIKQLKIPILKRKYVIYDDYSNILVTCLRINHLNHFLFRIFCDLHP